MRFFFSLSEKIFENTQYLHSVMFMASLHKELAAQLAKQVQYLTKMLVLVKKRYKLKRCLI